MTLIFLFNTVNLIKRVTDNNISQIESKSYGKLLYWNTGILEYLSIGMEVLAMRVELVRL